MAAVNGGGGGGGASGAVISTGGLGPIYERRRSSRAV